MTRSRKRNEPRIGLALGGGGAKGVSHIAFLQTLEDMGLRPSVLAATSVGAVVAGHYAGGMSATEIADRLPQANFADLVKALELIKQSRATKLKGQGMRKLLAASLPVHRFEDLEIPLKVVATDFWARTPVVFEAGDLVTAIRASMALPGLYDPVKLDGRVLIDGGSVDPLPFELIRGQCDILVAIDVSGEKQPKRKRRGNMPSRFEAIFSAFQIMQASIVQAKLRTADVDIYVKPKLENVRVLDFHKHREILDSVRDDVDDFRAQLTACLEAY